MASMCNDIAFNNLDPTRDALDFTKMLKPLDDVLRCRICYDYFNNCMITKCCHNYCSVCIRRYMLYKSQCPTCFQEASEPELRNNRLLDEVLRIYINIRDTLETTTQIKLEPQDEVFEQPNKPRKEALTSKKKDETETLVKTVVEAESVSTNDVSCPVCYEPVLVDRINIHLDRCLSLKEKSELSEKKHLPKLVYHLLSEKEIKKKLKAHGLSLLGNRQALIRRHKNFIVLYNANCDALKPKPVSELIKEIETQELEEKINSSARQNQVNKKSDISAIEKEHEMHIRKHQSQFNNLIHDVQQRELSQVTVKEETFDESIQSSGQATVKEEVFDESIQTCGSLLDETISNIGSTLGDISTEENSECGSQTPPLHPRNKTFYHTGSSGEKLISHSKKKEEKRNHSLWNNNSQHELDSFYEDKDITELAKNDKEIEDSLRSDSSTSLEDFEISKL